MNQFFPLTVSHVRKTIRDAVEVTLVPPIGVDFSFIQGQYLTFRREFDGVELRRSYSICSAVSEQALQVGIKAVQGGAFSTWANTELEAGMVLEAMKPMGRFHSDLDAGARKPYLLFAGGSGITPILSILRTVLALEPHSRCTLVYANRAPNTIMFREELEDLKNLYMARLSIIYVLESDAGEVELLRGRVDGAKCAALFETLVQIGSVDTAFICGPEPMMLAISDALRAHGLRDEQIKYELFASAQLGRLALPAQQGTAAQKGVSARVTLNGEERSFVVEAGQSLLDGALDAEIDAPYACKAGVCSTCKCRVLEGEVEMIANRALEDDEVAAGFVLSCQSVPISERVVFDYDQH